MTANPVDTYNNYRKRFSYASKQDLAWSEERLLQHANGVEARLLQAVAELNAIRSARNSEGNEQILGLIEQATLGSTRARLREKYGKIDIITDKPVAYDSPDHIQPWGTMRDNSRSQQFLAKLITLVPGDRLSLLDLGCSGGGQVRNMIELGYLSVGVEGSDFSLRNLRAEWLNIPDFLFTADITSPFTICSGKDDQKLTFSTITLWEVIEHIKEQDLPAVFKNIDSHLSVGGFVVMSVSPNSDIINGVELHQTIQEKPWWDKFLRSIGWRQNQEILEYLGNDLVRWEPNAPNSFHYVLSREGETPDLTKRASQLLKYRAK